MNQHAQTYTALFETPPLTMPVWSKFDILGGTPVFAGTRVPSRILFEYLEAGDSINDFLDEFPSVSRNSALAALKIAQNTICNAHTA